MSSQRVDDPATFGQRRAPTWVEKGQRVDAKGSFSTTILLVALSLVFGVSMAHAGDYTYTINNGMVTITGYTGNGGDVVIPGTLNGLPVTTIGKDAFYSCANLTKVVVPDSVTNIGESAFGRCTSLTSVTLPDSVTSIGAWALSWCGSLAGVTIPNSVTRLGENAFYACSSLTHIVIPDRITHIGQALFSWCSGLTNVSIPDSVTSIGSQAFWGCTSLTRVVIPGNVTNLDLGVFASCGNLTGVYFQGNAPSAGPGVFQDDFLVTVYYLAGTTGWGWTFGDRPTAMLTPPTPPTLRSVGMVNGAFGFTVTGTAGTTAVVEFSREIAKPVWLSLSTNTLANGTWHFIDPAWTRDPERFYRARMR